MWGVTCSTHLLVFSTHCDSSLVPAHEEEATTYLCCPATQHNLQHSTAHCVYMHSHWAAVLCLH